ncbi:hypothetical protein M422DRAFT_26972 [Sphaerobolus stellatus SS14]|uniref:Uncharacterized protein n=1 Tax=Sphaerobolus stellatus (strain SS14) TaxID=990650 RepID=A0A0C9UBQ7_SPHS4|nr:hypothetical protein M422DRAFT_32206 [Sphaerobolus stellatus SS14]KIJ50796.1 hypothetical protein M422DRAFT_26972 [Sphaerobolus stellatus SS14]
MGQAVMHVLNQYPNGIRTGRKRLLRVRPNTSVSDLYTISQPSYGNRTAMVCFTSFSEALSLCKAPYRHTLI